MDYSYSGLVQACSFELLDVERRVLGDLDGVLAATRERNIYASPRTSGSLELSPQEPIDWRVRRVRWWGASFARGESEMVPLFTGIPKMLGHSRDAARAPVSLKLLDFSTLLDVPLGSHTTVLPTETVTGRVREILLSVGATDPVITESSANLAAPMFRLATVTKRQIVNDLLAAIGYSAVWADEWGRLHCEPFVAPGDRPTRDLGFVSGPLCTYRPDLEVEDDGMEIPNHCIVTPRTDGDLEPPVGEAWLPEDHYYSFKNQGNTEVPLILPDVDLSVDPLPSEPTEAQKTAYLARLKVAADARAKDALLERSIPTRSFVVQNRWRPFQLQEAAPFFAPARGPAEPIETTVTVAKDSLRYTSGKKLDMTTTLLEVK